MTSRHGAAEVCTGIVEGVPGARADPNKRKFSSPRDMNPPTVKNAREEKQHRSETLKWHLEKQEAEKQEVLMHSRSYIS